MKGISIIICSYNSSSRIEATLEHIANQELYGLRCEVVLVDNNCSDDTLAVAQKKWKDCGEPFELRIVEEKEPGLSFARKTGVRAAEGETLIFCDDDNWLEKTYLQNVVLGFLRYPDAGILGAWSDASFEPAQLIPEWFEQIKGSMAVGGKPDNDCLVQEVWGAGMAILKIVASEIFLTNNVLSGRKGDSLVSGEDSEICEKARNLGYKIYKLTSLKYTHFITGNRLTWKYVTRLNKGFGFSSMENSFHSYNKSMFLLILGYSFYSLKTILKNPQGFVFYISKTSNKVSALKFYGIEGAWDFVRGNLRNN